MQTLLYEVLNVLKNKCTSDLRLGVFGSVARGEYNSSSDIDIVIDTADDKQSIEFMEEIRKYITDTFNRECDVTYLSSMRKEDEELDAFSIKKGWGVNECSAYKELLKDVVWCE